MSSLEGVARAAVKACGKTCEIATAPLAARSFRALPNPQFGFAPNIQPDPFT